MATNSGIRHVKEEDLKLVEGPAANVLIVVDVQNCFMMDGSLGSSGKDENFIQELVTLINNKMFDIIVFTKDAHPNNHASFSIYNPHCRNYTTKCTCIHDKNIQDLINAKLKEINIKEVATIFCMPCNQTQSTHEEKDKEYNRRLSEISNENEEDFNKKIKLAQYMVLFKKLKENNTSINYKKGKNIKNITNIEQIKKKVITYESDVKEYEYLDDIIDFNTSDLGITMINPSINNMNSIKGQDLSDFFKDKGINMNKPHLVIKTKDNLCNKEPSSENLISNMSNYISNKYSPIPYIIHINKGEYCKYDAYSGFNYHVSYSINDKGGIQEDIIDKDTRLSKEYETGLYDGIVTGLTTKFGENRPTNTNIYVCGLVGNICVMHTVVEGSLLCHKINKDNSYNRKKIPNPSFYYIATTGTRFLVLPPSLNINHKLNNNVDDEKMRLANKSLYFNTLFNKELYDLDKVDNIDKIQTEYKSETHVPVYIIESVDSTKQIPKTGGYSNKNTTQWYNKYQKYKLKYLQLKKQLQ